LLSQGNERAQGLAEAGARFKIFFYDHRFRFKAAKVVTKAGAGLIVPPPSLSWPFAVVGRENYRGSALILADS
jgi:hypothetical protein